MADISYPNLVNSRGIPTLLGTPSIETIGAVETLVITFQPHRALGANWSGAFFVNINGAVATGTQPVVFRTTGVAGFTPLMLYNGVQAEALNLLSATGGVVMCFYNKDNGKLQLVGSYE